MKSLVFASAAAALLSVSLANAETYELDVEGLDCPICAYALEREVSGLAGVEAFRFDFESGLVFITMQDGVALDRKTAEQVVDKAGYDLNGLKDVSDR